MVEEVGWAALGSVQRRWLAGVGFCVGKEQVIAPVVGVREVRDKLKCTGVDCGKFPLSRI